MQRPISNIIFTLWVASLAFGCGPNIHLNTPRSFVAAETSQVLEQGQFAVSGSYATASDENPTEHAGAARLRVGVAEDLELTADGALGWANLGDNQPTYPDNTSYALMRDSKWQGSGRLGARYHIVRGLSAGLGIGAGGFAGGFFGSADASFTASYENDYVVPFATLRVGYSGPIASRRIVFDAQEANYVAGEPDRMFREAIAPDGNFNFIFQGGARFSLCPRCDVEPALYLSAFIEMNRRLGGDYESPGGIYVFADNVSFGLSTSVEVAVF